MLNNFCSHSNEIRLSNYYSIRTSNYKSIVEVINKFENVSKYKIEIRLTSNR